MSLFCDSWKCDVLSFLFLACTLIYLFLRWNYSYWESKGFKTLPGFTYFLGHFRIPPKKTIGAMIADLYNVTTEPFIGIYTLFRPVLLVRDPELIRSILIKDFSHFSDRRVQFNEDFDPIQGNLLALPAHKWKPLRSKLTPTFSSGKLKAMFSTLVDCGVSLQNKLDSLADEKELLNVREIAAEYTTNIIASVAFGIDVDTIVNPNNEFRVYGRKIFESSFSNVFKRFILFSAPSLIRLLRLKALDTDVENFIMSVVRQNLELREKNNMVRKDFFQLLIQIRNSGSVNTDDDKWATEIKGDENQKKMTVPEMAAQTFIFFVAGFETSSSTLSFCLFELAKHSEIQQRVQHEIDNVLAANGGKITYESLSEMKYLEACIEETLRKYPILGVLSRACTQDYLIPGTDKIIKKGMEIFIPVYALQMDSKYYEEPQKFNPDRFNEENATDKKHRPYLPFGDGPRNCIGMRLGKMQTKVGLVLMLQKFRFELENESKNRELEFDPKSALLAPLGGVHLRVFKRK